MSSDITLSSAQRRTLQSLQLTGRLSDRTQVRLATGREINAVTDGAQEYFSARVLRGRADTFLDRADGIDQGISTIETALEGIDALDEILGQLRGVTRQVRSQSLLERKESTKTFTELLDQFKLLLADTTYQGLNLLDNTQASLTVEFSEIGDSDLTIYGVNVLASGGVGRSTGAIFASAVIQPAHSGNAAGDGNVAGLFRSNILNIRNGFSAPYESKVNGGITRGFSALSLAHNLASLDDLDAILSGAQTHLQTRANALGSNVAILQTRFDYTNGIARHLVTGSDKIVNADLNQEAANLTATGTQYQIGISSLGTTGQRIQALLQIIR